jgi:HEAT repeat protein
MSIPDSSWQDTYRNDPRSTLELINLALLPKGDDLRWSAIVTLHYRGSQEVLDEARELISSSEPHYRATGIDILAQLGVEETKFAEECKTALLAMFESERDPDVLESLGIAFSHRPCAECVEPLVQLWIHPDKRVRYGVVMGLHCVNDERVIQPLIQLSADEDTDVRNWATFGLGTQQDRDTLAIRAALRARLNDSDEETRGEALLGLALRQDPFVLQPLIAELQGDLEDSRLALEAAAALADPRLISVLEERARKCPDDKAQIEEALAKCKGFSNDY